MATRQRPADRPVTVDDLTQAERVSLLAGHDFWTLNGVPRLGVPAITVTDGPYGVRKARASSPTDIAHSEPATCFPTSSALAATWDEALLEEVGAAIGREAAALGVSVVLGPGANLKRTALCGRNFEYFSEDPLLSGRLAAAWIRGVQGEGVGASLKHYAANNQETRRMSVDAVVDERALRELYLAGFEHAVAGGRPWTVMAAYNRLNGTYCSEHPWLLDDVLRREWGFDGVVMSDWGAVSRRAAAVEAGLDLEMPGFAGRSDGPLLRALDDGRLDGAAVDASAARILDLVARTAAAREPGRAADADAHHALARRAAEAGTVLLKNDGGLLPLAPGGRVAVVGAFAKEPRYQGSGSATITPTRLDDAWSELIALLGEDRLAYAPGYRTADDAPDAGLIAEAVAAARDADIVLAFVGLTDRAETEGVDREHLRLPPAHDALVAGLADACPSVVVVLVNGAPVELPWADRVPAIVEAYLGGQAGGSAIARVLAGVADPGGRLAETFPVRLEDDPVHALPAGPRLAEYRESLYVGYRWYDSAGVDVRFPFGHGLAYTAFEYGELEVRASDLDPQAVTVAVTVTNSGPRAGDEVVQVYVHDPESSVFRPRQELAGFARVRVEAGASVRVEVPLGRRAFATWDTASHDWRVEGGAFEVRIGRSSRDIRATAVVELLGDPADAGVVVAPEVAAVVAAYRDPRPDRPFERAAFEALLGRALPPNEPDAPGEYTINTPLADMRTPAAQFLHSMMARQALAFVGGDADSPLGRIVAASIADSTLRMFRMMGGDAMDERTLAGLVAVANGRYGLGTRTLLRSGVRVAQVRARAGRAAGGAPAGASWSDGYVDANGLRLHYWRTGGEGPVVVFNHGAMDDGLCWTRVVRELEGRFDCVMVDARGHGLSDSGDGDYSSAARADDLAAVIRALALDRPVVGGHSMGGDTSIHLAARHPGLARAVFLEDPPLLTPGEPVFGGEIGRRMGDGAAAMARMMAMIKRLPAPAGRAMARRLTPTYPDSEIRPWVDSKRRVSDDFLGAMRHSTGMMDDADNALREVRVPVLLLIGDRDSGAIVSESIAAEAEAAVPSLRVVHLAGATHDVRRTRFEGYMAALTAFLDEVTRD